MHLLRLFGQHSHNLLYLYNNSVLMCNIIGDILIKRKDVNMLLLAKFVLFISVKLGTMLAYTPLDDKCMCIPYVCIFKTF